MSNGYVIDGTPICVDYWRSKPNQTRFHFLTHCHADHMVGLTPSWRRPIYCTRITAKLTAHFVSLSGSLFRVIQVNETIAIDYDDLDGQERSFFVTALEADHCRGAVMFLFEGWFGRILSTGDFRYENDQSIEMHRLYSAPIDRLYLDATNWATSPRDIMKRSKATLEILTTIASRPEGELILLAMPQTRLGKEELLARIAANFNAQIYVEPERLEILKLLDFQHPEPLFTKNKASARFRLLPCQLGRIAREYEDESQSGKSPFIIVTSSFDIMAKAYGSGDSLYYELVKSSRTIPYSCHSSREELEQFLSLLKVHRIIPIACKGDLNSFRKFETPSSLPSPTLLQEPYFSCEPHQTSPERKRCRRQPLIACGAYGRLIRRRPCLELDQPSLIDIVLDDGPGLTMKISDKPNDHSVVAAAEVPLSQQNQYDELEALLRDRHTEAVGIFAEAICDPTATGEKIDGVPSTDELSDCSNSGSRTLFSDGSTPSDQCKPTNENSQTNLQSSDDNHNVSADVEVKIEASPDDDHHGFAADLVEVKIGGSSNGNRRINAEFEDRIVVNDKDGVSEDDYSEQLCDVVAESPCSTGTSQSETIQLSLLPTHEEELVVTDKQLKVLRILYCDDHDDEDIQMIVTDKQLDILKIFNSDPEKTFEQHISELEAVLSVSAGEDG